MELSKQKTKVITDPRRYTWLIYGEEGIGKSTLASQMDGTYFIATEPGHKALEVYKSDVSSWAEFKDVARKLISEKHEFKTVAVDTVTNLVDFCAASIYEEHNISHMSDLDWGKGFSLVRDEFKRVMIPLCNAQLGIVFIAHDMLREMEFRGFKRDVWQPNMIKTARTVINQLVDFIGRMYVDTIKEGDAMHRYRFITFAKHPDMVTKDRLGLLEKQGDIRLPKREAMWATLMAYFEKEKDKQNRKEITSG